LVAAVVVAGVAIIADLAQTLLDDSVAAEFGNALSRTSIARKSVPIITALIGLLYTIAAVFILTFIGASVIIGSVAVVAFLAQTFLGDTIAAELEHAR
jgi:hypothetical protein